MYIIFSNAVETITKEHYTKENHKKVHTLPFQYATLNNNHTPTTITASPQRMRCSENFPNYLPSLQKKNYHSQQANYNCQFSNQNQINGKNIVSPTSYLDQPLQNTDNFVRHPITTNGNYCYETTDGFFITSQPIKPCYPNNSERRQDSFEKRQDIAQTPQLRLDRYSQQSPAIVCYNFKNFLIKKIYQVC